MLMRLIDTIKNNLFEILAICVIVIGTTSGVLVTLYEIQIAKTSGASFSFGIENEYKNEELPIMWSRTITKMDD